MAVKLTKRKGFNFFRSYLDVYNEIETDSDKVAFIDALLNRQFFGVKPTDLKGLARFAYISQTNSIDSQVKGYEDKTKSKLNPLEVNNYTPTQPPTVGVNKKTLTPTLQVQVEEKGKEKGQYVYTKNDFLIDWNVLRLKHLNKPSFLNTLRGEDLDNFTELTKDYSQDDFKYSLVGLFRQKKLPNNQTSMQSNPKHFLKFFNTYFTAYHDKNTNLYGKQNTDD
tara:strand:+ start:601 stop:1269 length:669 start_codon:yes stop_codon:yes gene_type:complete